MNAPPQQMAADCAQTLRPIGHVIPDASTEKIHIYEYFKLCFVRRKDDSSRNQLVS